MKKKSLSREQLNQMDREQLIEKVLESQEQNDVLQEELNKTKALLFGRRTEKRETVTEDQIRFEFNEIEAAAPAEVPEEEVTVREHVRRKKAAGKKEEDLSKLPKEIVVHSIPEEELRVLFPEGWKRLPDEVYSNVEYEPAKCIVKEHHIEVYSGKKEDRIIRANHPAELLQSSIATPSLVAGIMNGKYVNALPLYRMEQEFRRSNVPVSRQTMAGWVIRTTERYLSLICDRLKEELLSHSVLHADETPVQVTKDGRPAGSKSYMWVYRSSALDDRPVVIYDYRKTRKTDHPKEFLQEFRGTLVTDGYEVYHKLARDRSGEIQVAGCWVHLKRKYSDAIKAMGKSGSGTAFDDLLREGAGAGSGNQELFYNLEEIHDAIIRKRKIAFTYCSYGIDRKLREAAAHTASPYYVTMQGQEICLTAFSEQAGEIAVFRIDRLRDVRILAENRIEITRAPGYDERIDYRSGSVEERKNILLRADRSVLDDLVETYGERALIVSDPEDAGSVIASIEAGPQAAARLAGRYPDRIEILAPPELRQRVRASLNKSLAKYSSASPADPGRYRIALEEARTGAKPAVAGAPQPSDGRKSAKALPAAGLFNFSCTYSEEDELTPEQLIGKMADQINNEGYVIVPERPYLTARSERGSKWLRCEALFEARVDAEAVRRDFRMLYDTLAEAAALSRGGTFSSQALRKQLTKEAWLLWRNYIQDIGTGRLERDIERSAIRLISRDLSRGEPEPAGGPGALHLAECDPVPEDEDVFLYWNHSYEIRTAARDRCLSQGSFNFDELIRAKRLYYLMLFSAPEHLIEREARRLAQYMALDRFPSRVLPFSTFEGIALPLYQARNVDFVQEILSDLELYDPIDPEELEEAGCREFARWLWHSRELNPKQLNIEGIDASRMYGRGWPDFLLYPDAAFSPEEDRTGVTEEDAVRALRAAAAALGIDEDLVGWYRIPWGI